MLRTINYTGRSKINRDEVRITISEELGMEPSFEAEFDFLQRFPEDSSIYVEAYYKETLQRFSFGTVGNVTRPADRKLSAVDLTGTTLFRVRVVDESGQIGRLLGAAEALRPEGSKDDDNSDSLMTLKTGRLESLPWKVEVPTDGSKPCLIINNKIPDPLNRAKSDPGFYALILPGALHQVLYQLMLNEPDEDDAEANQQRDRWLELATKLESDPPDTNDRDLFGSWVERVVEAFCRREDMTNALVNHLEGVES